MLSGVLKPAPCGRALLRALPWILLAGPVAAQSGPPSGGQSFYIAGQATLLVVLLVVGVLFWQLMRATAGKIGFQKVGTWVVAGFLLALLAGLLVLVSRIFMAGRINAGVVLGMITGIICIVILIQALRS